jgi:sugar/nucleoside kinase (ribokinase family)
MKKILGMGNALVDVMTLLDDDSVLEKFALPKGSMQLVDAVKSEIVKSGTANNRKTLASGGSAANTIHGLAMLGAETGFIGSIGKDELGDFFEGDMRAASVKTYLFRRDSITGTAVALITKDSERTFATHLGAAVELTSADIKKDIFQGFDILYLEGYLIFNKDLVEAACVMAKNSNMKIAMDLASYNVVEACIGDFTEILEKYVDIVFANAEEAKAFTGKGPEEALDKLSEICEIGVVKVGSEGSLIKRREEVIRIGTTKVNLKDTTGAGDLYAAGFLYGYSRGFELDICGQYGAVLAGRVIEILGARIPAETWGEIKKVISEIN